VIGVAGQELAPDLVKTSDQVVLKESSLSMVVKDVRQSADQVVSYAKSHGGVFVSENLNSPEESPLATVAVRVPSDRLTEAVGYFRTLAVKVSSENLLGVDITRQFADLDVQIKVLQEGIKRLEAIRDKATSTSDLLTATREILSLQQQVDALTSQKKTLEQSANLSAVTVFLATDELALPYQPPSSFRPDAIFKLAVRSLFTNVYALGEAAIWLAVYSIIWLPLLLLVWYLARRVKLF
jgi:hypothetical protein